MNADREKVKVAVQLQDCRFSMILHASWTSALVSMLRISPDSSVDILFERALQ